MLAERGRLWQLRLGAIYPVPPCGYIHLLKRHTRDRTRFISGLMRADNPGIAKLFPSFQAKNDPASQGYKLVFSLFHFHREDKAGLRRMQPEPGLSQASVRRNLIR